MGAEILETLRSLGVTVEVIGPDRLRFQPASRIPADLVARIQEAKPQILAALAKRRVPSPCWHCGAKRACNCITCCEPHAKDGGWCVVCHGEGTVLVWVN